MIYFVVFVEEVQSEVGVFFFVGVDYVVVF